MKLDLAGQWYATGVTRPHAATSAAASLTVLGFAIFAAMLSGSSAQAQTISPQPRIVSAPQTDKLVTLRGNVHPLARPQNDRGVLPDQQPVTRMHLLLQRSAEQEAALQQLMADQLDSTSPRFHQWLTPLQFGEQFGPADSDIQTIKDWLASQGFTDIRVNNGKTLIEFSGTAGQIRNAFHTEIHRLSVNSEEHFANWSEPQIPAALAPVVKGIVGLHNFRPKPHLQRFGKFQRNAVTGEVTPLFTYSDVNGTFYGVGPSDFATIYNTPTTLNAHAPAATYDGSNVSIAIVAQSNINLQDLADFRSIFGLQALNTDCSTAPYVCVVLNGPDPGLVSGDEGESDLDTQWASAVAPKANIIFVSTLLTATDGLGGVDSSAEYIIDNNLAPIMSESYGACEPGLGTAGNAFYNTLWQQGAAQGISIMVSAGDNGSAGCDDQNSESVAGQNATAAAPAAGQAVSGIASTPFNVAMGGTDFNQAGQQTTYWNSSNGTGQVSAKGYIPEMPWNDSCAAAGSTGCATVTVATPPNCPSCIVAGSGGPSSVYPKPSWQSTSITGMPPDNKRDLPDLSLFSATGAVAKSFYIVCESDQDIPGDTGCNLTKFVSSPASGPFHDFQAVGGTSAAAPAFAGIMALVVQKTGQRQGNPNPELYNLAKSESFASCDSSTGSSGSSSNTTCIFNDITPNKPSTGNAPNLNIAVPCAGGSTDCSKSTSGGFGILSTSTGGSTIAYSTTAGYDLATGLGTPNVANLVSKWSTASATGTATTVSLAPGSVNGTAGTVSGNLTGTVSGAGGTPSGVVILENAATNAPLTSTSLSGGSFSIPAALLPAASATYSVKAHYSGDATFAPSDSNSISVNLSKQASKVVVSFVTFNAATNPPTPVLSTSQQSVQYGSPYILRVDVENNSGVPCENFSTGVVSFVCPIGSVSLLDGGQPLKDFPNAQTPNASNTARLNDRGFIEDQPIQLAAGAHSITATYTADATSSYTSQSTSNTLSVTITTATTTTTVAPSVTTITSGGSITLTATVSSQSNSAQGPTGTVQFLNGGSNLGAAATCTPAPSTTDSSGKFVGASCTAKLTTTLSSLPPGFFTPQPRGTPLIIVGWLAAVLAVLSFVTALRLAARRRQFAYAALVLALIATGVIAGCGGGISSTGGGNTRSITAKYTGDTNYAGSTSSVVSITIQ